MKKLILFFVILSSQALAHPGVGIVMDSKGNVFYTDLKQVLKINSRGQKSVAVRDVHSHELYIDSLDNLFGEHVWYNDQQKSWAYYVWKLSGDGTLVRIVAPTEGANESFSFVRDHRGNGYFANRSSTCQKVVCKNAVDQKKRSPDHCLANIRWMTATPSGTVYVMDFHDLKKIDGGGQATTVVENIPQKKFASATDREQHYVSGISTDRQNNIFVADYSGRQVKKISPSGKMTVVAETLVPWSPAGQLVAPNGDFWLLEYSVTNEARVERIRVNGGRTVF